MNRDVFGYFILIWIWNKSLCLFYWIQEFTIISEQTSISTSPHPSWKGHSTIFVNREVVYYILSGTPRSTQKYFWSNLRVEFLGENHLLLICGNIPNQTFWITKKLDSWLNSDLFKKKVCPNRTCLDCFRYHFFVIFWKWEPLLDSYNFGISGQIWTIFF